VRRSPNSVRRSQIPLGSVWSAASMVRPSWLTRSFATLSKPPVAP